MLYGVFFVAVPVGAQACTLSLYCDAWPPTVHVMEIMCTDGSKQLKTSLFVVWYMRLWTMMFQT
jgi:hypothetical protein